MMVTKTLVYALALALATALGSCGGTDGSTTDKVTRGGTGNGGTGNGGTGNGDGNGDGGDLVGDPGPKIQVINEPGELIDIADFMPAGHVTVIDFYADWCGACKIAEEKLVAGIEQEPRIVVRKVNIDDDTSPVAKHYDVGALPHLRVYDRHGQLAYVLVGNDAMTAAEKAFEVLNR